MGNNPSIATEEQNEAAGREAQAIFQLLDLNADQCLGREEWEQAFTALDENADGNISRKEWYLKQGTTEMYDAIFKKSSGNITRQEWDAAFDLLDSNKDGQISIAEWLARKQVRLSFAPLMMTANNWGVGVGDDFYEVVSTSWMQNEMVVVGPNGIIATGEFAKEEGAKERWMEGFRGEIEQGKKPEGMWHAERGEPRARPEDVWHEHEVAGWTMKSNEDIEAWILEWVEEHPVYKGVDAIGRECNDQTFALAFISWLTNSNYKRLTDNTKGRALVYGGLALVAGVGAIYLANRMNKPKAEEPQRDRLPSSQSRQEPTATVGTTSSDRSGERRHRSTSGRHAGSEGGTSSGTTSGAAGLLAGLRQRTGAVGTD